MADTPETTAADIERQKLAEKQAREKAMKEAQLECERQDLIKRQEKSRVETIFALGERFTCASLRDKALEENWSVEQMRTAIMDQMNPSTVARFQSQTEATNSGRSIGEIFINSPQYRELSRKMAPGDKGVHQRGQFTVSSDRVDFNTRAMDRAYTTPLALGGDSGQLTSYYTTTQGLPGVPGLLDQQQLRIAQVFPQGATTARRVSWIKEDAFSNFADSSKEAAIKSGGDINISETYVDIEKITVYTKVTEEMLADAEQIRSYLDSRLAYMVQAKEDNYLVNGSGTAPQIRGLANVSGINTLAATAYDTVADAFGFAINAVRTNGFVEPDAILVHPTDWMKLKTAKDSNGQYLGGGPYFGAYGVGGFTNVGTMWGLPVVNSTFITAGTAYVGAFRIGSMLWRRQGVTVEATNTNDTDFVYNLITIRAEARMAPAFYKPLAFCQITGIA